MIKKKKFDDVPNPDMFTDLDFVRLLLCLPTEVRASQPPSRHLRAPRIPLPRTTNYQYCYYRISESLLLPLSATAIDYHYYRLPNVTSSCETNEKKKKKTKQTKKNNRQTRTNEKERRNPAISRHAPRSQSSSVAHPSELPPSPHQWE